MLALQQFHSPPGEEVGRVAVVLVGARLGSRVLVPYQRGFLDKVAKGVEITLGADIAKEVVLGTGVKIASATVHFHGFGVARQGPWNTWVNRGEKKAGTYQ